MTAAIVVLAVLGWLTCALLSVAVVACAGRTGHEEDLRRRYAPDQPASSQTQA